MTSRSQPDTNKEFHQSRAAFHEAAIRARLSELGFDHYAKIKLQPKEKKAVPLAFVTGVNAEQFDPEKHTLTDTKAIVEAGNGRYMLNQSAALVAVMLAQTNDEIVMQVKPEAVDRIKRIFATLPGYERLHIIPVATDSKSLTEKFYQAAAGISEQRPIARVDLVLYESFAAGLEQPFRPIYAEDPANVAQAVAKRAAFYQQMCMIAYDLLCPGGQDSLRILSLTALAARRVGGNLLADAAHKQISTNYIETLANEVGFQLPTKKIHCVEIAPGIVDNGIYDSKPAREATVERAMINGFPFRDSAAAVKDIKNLPKLSPFDIAKIGVQYLTHAEGEEFHDKLPLHLQELSQAGRERDELKAVVHQEKDGSLTVSRELPSWALTPGTTIGRFAPLKKGYQFVPVCPKGQFF